MGSRGGFRTKDKSGKFSQILRQQRIGLVEEGVTEMWWLLGGKPGDGGQAIRDDLDNGRAFAALVASFYKQPFNSIEDSTLCDISDNGLFTVDVSDFAKWKIIHTEIGWQGEDDGKQGTEKLIATMSADGFEWVISDEERENTGEGI